MRKIILSFFVILNLFLPALYEAITKFGYPVIASPEGEAISSIRLLEQIASPFRLAMTGCSNLTATSYAEELTKDSAYSIADAYQVKGVSDAVGSMLRDEVGKAIEGSVREWFVESVQDNLDIKTPKNKQKEQMKAALKEKIKENLPKFAKEILYEKVFLGEFGDEVGDAKKIVDQVVDELKVTLNERIDMHVGGYYDELLDKVESKLRYGVGPVNIDLTNIRSSIDALVNINNLEYGVTEALSYAFGDATANTIQDRIKDTLAGEFPSEVVKYLDYGPEKFAEYAGKVKEYLPGKKIDELKDRLLHMPLFVLPNSVYGAILAGSAATHFAAAYKGVTIDPYELKRGVEVSKVMLWQLKNKEGLSVDLASFLDALDMFSTKFGVNLKDLGSLGQNLALAQGKIEGLDQKIKDLDAYLEGKIDFADGKLRELVEGVKGKLTDFQKKIFQPINDAYDKVDEYIKDANSKIKGMLPENFNGIPADWEAFKKTLGREDGLLGEFGDMSPWDLIHGYYEYYKEQLKKWALIVNDKVSGSIANNAVDIVDVLGFTDKLAKALKVEKVPEGNNVLENESDPVYFHNGEFYEQNIDLFIPSVGINYEFKRTYRSKAGFKGVLGFNWMHNYEEYIVRGGSGYIYINGDGKRTDIRSKVNLRCSDDSVALGFFEFDCKGIKEAYRKEGEYVLIVMDNGFTFLTKDNLKKNYNYNGNLVSITDRFGNSLQFAYDKYGRVKTVIDTRERRISYLYNKDGLLSKILDFSGREVSFQYDRYFDLISVTSPKTFDYPEGKSIRYAYSTGLYDDANLNHNLKLIMDPKGDIYLKNIYGKEGFLKDRVIVQKYGEGPLMKITYYTLLPVWIAGADLSKPVSLTYIIDREGIFHRYTYNVNGSLIREEFKDEDNVWQVFYAAKLNNKGLLVSERSYGNAEVKYTYESSGAWLGGLNVVRKEVGGKDDARVTLFKYDEKTNEMIEVVYSDGRVLSKAFCLSKFFPSLCKGEGGKVESQITLTSTSAKPSLQRRVTSAQFFNTSGQMVKSVDPLGGVTLFEYDDASGNLIAIIKDAEGFSLRTSFEYDNVGNVIGVTHPSGAREKYLVNGLNQIIEEQKEDLILKYAFDHNDNLEKIDLFDSRNHAFVGGHMFKYDFMDNMILKESPVSIDKHISAEYKYDYLSKLVEEILSYGRTKKYQYNNAALLTQITEGGNGLNRKLSFVYEDGRIVRAYDSGKKIAEYEYNIFGEVIRTKDALNRISEYVYDKMGRLVQKKIFNHNQELISFEKYSYDIFGNMTLFSEYDLAEKEWNSIKRHFNAGNLLEMEKDELGLETHYFYNGLGKVLKKKFSSGQEVLYNYDSYGYVKESLYCSANSEGQCIKKSFKYDKWGRLVYSSEPSGYFTKYEYDLLGNLITVSADSKLKSYKYDLLGRKIETLSFPRKRESIGDKWIPVPAGMAEMDGMTAYARTVYEWDDLGRLVKMTDAGKRITQFQYDVLDRLITMTMSEGEKYIYSYDIWDNPISITDPNKNHFEQDFDAAGQLISRKLKRGERVIGSTLQQFAYDGLGRLIYVFDNNNPDNVKDDSKVYLYYNMNSEVVGEIQNGRKMIKDIRDFSKNIQYSSGISAYSKYNGHGFLDSIFENGSFEAGFNYNNNEISRISFDNGMSIDMSYDEFSRLSKIGIHDKGIKYSYYNNGRVSKVRGIDSKEKLYTYDNAGRLVSLSNKDETVKWSLDNLSNMNGLTDEASEYDANGNLVRDSFFEYFYDALNRLTLVKDYNANLVARYIYDALGRRISKSVGRQNVNYVYDGWNVIEEYVNDELHRSYTYSGGLDSLFSFTDHDNGRRYYYMLDTLGSVSLILDHEGEIVCGYDYKPYGELNSLDNDIKDCNDMGFSQPYQYAGRRVDSETGLMYYRNRYYNPKTGMFISRDPLGFKMPLYSTSGSQSHFHLSFHRRRKLTTYPNNILWMDMDASFAGVAGFNRLVAAIPEMTRDAEPNLYLYAGADPVNMKDPLGLDYLWVTGQDRAGYVGANDSSGHYADLYVFMIKEPEIEGAYGGFSNHTVDYWHGSSGPWGNGALPTGEYNGYYLRQRKDNTGMMVNNFGWALNIDPKFNTSRSLFRIHPDGNGFGSKGCIAIDKDGYRDMYNRLNEYLPLNQGKGTSIDVYVNIRDQSGNYVTDSRELNMMDRYIRSHARMVFPELGGKL